MSDTQDMIGRTLGFYTIQRILGRGGMGIVFQALDMNLHRPVALKILPPEFAFDESFVSRFIREARAAAQLNHPNIVTIYSVGEDSGIYYIAMEYIEGITVEQRIKQEGPIPGEAALKYIRQCAEALKEAHTSGMIHRDIKPSNIMIDAKGIARVMDFGLVSAQGGSSKLTAAGTLMGTPTYIAPEVYSGAESDARVDLYALGITFYEMLAGQAPFSSDTPAGMMYHALNTPIPVDALRTNGVPTKLIRIVEAMTHKDPEHRVRSAEDIITFLDTGKMPKPAPALNLHAPTIKMERPSVPLNLPKLPSLPKLPAVPKLPRFSKKAVAIIATVPLILLAIYGYLQREIEAPEVEAPVVQQVVEKPVPMPNFDEWTTPSGDAPESQWNIEENTFHTAASEGSPTAKLQSRDWWRNFELSMEVKVAPLSFAALNLRNGARVELRGSAVSGVEKTSSLKLDDYGEVAAQAEFNPDQWHRVSLRNVGNTLTVTLNDETVHYKSKKAELPVPAPIVLELSSGSAWFRRVEMRSLDLPATPPRRSMAFPNDISIGKLTYWSPGEFLASNLQWRGEAQGTQSISRGMEVGLLPSEPALRNLQFLNMGPIPDLNGLIIAAVPFEPEHLSRLSRLPNLSKLAFVSSNITNEHLRHLPRMPRLDQLIISGEAQLSKDALAGLPLIDSLRVLLVENCMISAEGINLAARFPQLVGLSFRACNLNRRTLENTSPFKSLRYLDLSETPAPSSVLAILDKMPALHALDLSLCSLIDDEALGLIFNGKTQLRELNISYTGITRDALLTQAKSETLRTLHCVGSGCTAADVEALKKNLPNCEIKY